MRVLFYNYVSNGPFFNSGIAALSSYLKKNNPRVKTALINAHGGTTSEELQKKVAAFEPDLIAFSIHTPHWPMIADHISLIRRSADALLLCGGYHPTLCPEEVIGHPDVEVVCRGEGEQPVLELVECMEQGRSFAKVPGLWVKNRTTGEISQNPLPDLPVLDELPFWDRDIYFDAGLTAEQFSLTHIQGFPLASGRGCPYNCYFCNNASILKMYTQRPGGKAHQYVRKMSLDRVLAECRFLVERYDAGAFEFWDEMFASDRQWVFEFCRRYQEEIGKPFICALRVEKADREMLQVLHDAGCKCLFMGVEVGNAVYRKKFLNRGMSNQTIKDAYDNALEIGIERFAWVMLGLPGETPELIEETIQFLKEIKPDIIGWSVFHPLPGTYLYEYCREKGYLSDEVFSPYQGAPSYEVPILRQPSLSHEEVIRYCESFRALKDLGFKVNT